MYVQQRHVASTPPLGWNSWNCYGTTVNQEKIKIQAEAMVTSGLKDHGFVYVNIDDGWQGDRGGAYGAIQPNGKFPNIRGLCDYAHGLGLKIGIYSTPWRRSFAGYTGGCGHEREDARQFAEWGIDFLKYDWKMSRPTEPNEKYLEHIRVALDATGRDIVLSISNTAPLTGGKIWSRYANMWRTTDDVKESWESVSQAFNQSAWKDFSGPGHFNDSDMMVVGHIGWGEDQHPARLTRDEQISHVTLWSILASPIILGCDLTRIDDFTRSLLINDEVLAIHQDILGMQGYRIWEEEKIEVWMKPLENYKNALAIFNRGDTERKTEILWKNIGISPPTAVRDAWTHINREKNSEGCSVSLNSHGVNLFVIT